MMSVFCKGSLDLCVSVVSIIIVFVNSIIDLYFWELVKVFVLLGKFL